MIESSSDSVLTARGARRNLPMSWRSPDLGRHGLHAVASIRANLTVLGSLTDCRGVIVTAKGDTVDFVSRFFAPQSGIPEDHVTGSAHTTLTPYWAQRLQRSEFQAIQLSPRKGFLHCKNAGERIEIGGQAKTYLIGEIFLK